MVIICWNRRVSRRSQACLTFSLYMEGRWVKIKTREEKFICNPDRHWEILEDSGWINHDVFEPILKRSHWWDSDCRLESQGGGCKAILANGVMSVRQTRSVSGFKHKVESYFMDVRYQQPHSWQSELWGNWSGRLVGVVSSCQGPAFLRRVCMFSLCRHGSPPGIPVSCWVNWWVWIDRECVCVAVSILALQWLGDLSRVFLPLTPGQMG